jgi:hypothetical protein
MNEQISDELLAAYLDGNTSPIENLLVEANLGNDASFMEISDIISDMATFSQIENYNEDLTDIGLGDIFSQTITLDNDTLNEVMDPNGIVPDIQQQYPDSCAIKSQQIILNEFGIDVNEDQLVQFSYEQGWYHADGTGTAAEDVGNLLETANIPVTRQDDANVFNLVSELSQGHKVIVGVDSEELWGNKFMAWMKDFFMGDTPDHALVVAGIDTSDPNNVMVIVDDPGSGEYHKAYPLDQFMDAWSDAQCYMVSTDIPVPDHSAAMANFDYGQGHIADVGGMDYADFQIFNDISYGLPAYSMIDDGYVSPTSSLMDAYFDVANNDLAFNDIFSDNYMFNDYLNTDIATQMMQQTYQDNLSMINFDDMPNGMDYANLNSNQDYENFLHGSIDYFNSIGDFDSAMLCEQQLMMVDYCDSYDIDFCSTFFG